MSGFCPLSETFLLSNLWKKSVINFINHRLTVNRELVVSRFTFKILKHFTDIHIYICIYICIYMYIYILSWKKKYWNWIWYQRIMVKQLAVRNSILIHNIKDGTQCQAAYRFYIPYFDRLADRISDQYYIYCRKKSRALVGSLSILQWTSKGVAIIV